VIGKFDMAPPGLLGFVPEMRRGTGFSGVIAFADFSSGPGSLDGCCAAAATAGASGKAPVAHHAAPVITRIITAPDSTTRLADIVVSFAISCIRLNKCRRRANAAAGTSRPSSANAISASR
jgi:hypothetical protein